MATQQRPSGICLNDHIILGLIQFWQTFLRPVVSRPISRSGGQERLLRTADAEGWNGIRRSSSHPAQRFICETVVRSGCAAAAVYTRCDQRQKEKPKSFDVIVMNELCVCFFFLAFANWKRNKPPKSRKSRWPSWIPASSLSFFSFEDAVPL